MLRPHKSPVPDDSDHQHPRQPRSRLRRLVARLRTSPSTQRAASQAAYFENSPLTQSPHSSPTWVAPPLTRSFHSPVSSPTTAATWQRQFSHAQSPMSIGNAYRAGGVSAPARHEIRDAKLSRQALIRKLFTAFQLGDASFALQDVEAWLQARDASRAAKRDCVTVMPSRVQMVRPSPAEFLQWQQDRISLDSDEETESELERCGREMTYSLWAALEKSRRVVEEERLKFEMLMAEVDEPRPRRRRQRPANRELGRAQSHRFDLSAVLTSVKEEENKDVHRTPRWMDFTAGSPGGDRHLRRLLKLHRHRPPSHRHKLSGTSLYSLTRSSSCPPSNLDSPVASRDRDCTQDGRFKSVRHEDTPHTIQTTHPPTPKKPPALVGLRLTLPPRGSDIDFTGFGFKHVDFLAEGSLGQLHLVQSLNVENCDGRLWVAKVVDLSTFGDPVEASQALLEAELLRRLKHPNIVQYLASFVTDSSLVIIMEYCEKGDLHGYLNKLRKDHDFVDEAQIVRWISDIASGLDHMHKQNILHCDVKSSNVFIDKNMVAKIGDLGIARELRRGSLALSPIRCPRGTPVYMSPEMCSKAALTERTDCWSLGCIVFEMCHLKHAFPSQLVLGQRRRRRRVSEKHSTVSDASVDSRSTSTSAAFLPGITARSNMSFMCREMLTNLKSDLKKLKHTSVGPNQPLISLQAQPALPFWSSGFDADDKTVQDTFYLPQILPPRYSPLLNYLVCAMLEPRPADRPSLNQIIQILREADASP
eukprot:Blabericola_migrator_1__10787@NODE_619_length_7247_cov_387_220752_g452_i0_p1_GENE_NODE_619_length_7247_cov_387_220752_g452_i0NODE_619_length_7247_cov_387_220752_g452_i0_p1_ORF_typecomplete_len759_score139_62Pkinase/PF00069_25/9_9e57Pkinase_Tyr/PF07714_17/2_3e42Pkinase_Tyr/PF07714_17/1_3e02Kinaselike/PF14531_6/1_6e09Pkinase_fungal/PF17667_1/3_3e08Kdo/PF06293_14/1_6e06WaaY/PF06176_11/0_00089RIO1/PF01163_22/0_0016PIP49_C/PF12260_8/0_33PIP49_C/PF12260_8/1e03MitMem_reg/PF13012_6/5_8e03MitMem_reg/PF13